MSAQFDVVIRNGLVVDGTGAEPRRADVAIKDGLIAAVGEVKGKGAEEIDANGLLVTPGFVDLHTHYDGQAIWSKRLNPSSSHGVTTILMGKLRRGLRIGRTGPLLGPGPAERPAHPLSAAPRVAG